MLFLTPNRKMLVGKFVNCDRVLALLDSILLPMSSELRLIKWGRFFERNCIVKWVNFFASFCWLRDFLLENEKIKKKRKLWIKYKKVVCPKLNRYFLKKGFQIWDFKSIIFWSRFRFLGFRGILYPHFSSSVKKNSYRLIYEYPKRSKRRNQNISSNSRRWNKKVLHLLYCIYLPSIIEMLLHC